MCTLEKEFSNIDIYIQNVKKRRFFWGGGILRIDER